MGESFECRAVVTVRPSSGARSGPRCSASSNVGNPNDSERRNFRAATPVREEDTENGRKQAELVTGPERDALYAGMVELLPAFAEYERKTERRIPVFAVRRVDA